MFKTKKGFLILFNTVSFKMNTHFDHIISNIHMETVDNCLIKNESINCSLFVQCILQYILLIHVAVGRVWKLALI